MVWTKLDEVMREVEEWQDNLINATSYRKLTSNELSAKRIFTELKKVINSSEFKKELEN